ncbi:MAG TPA: AraC family transcriptional regulator [Steroidobacteraceae bacterium]|nr:AraC family transcriptional regulator [Steroidobacteraceae bacterium]
MLKKLGVDPATVLSEFGLTTAHFDHPDNTLSFGTRSALLGRCALAAQCPHFGLLVGLRGSTSVFGAIGFLMQSATDVRKALAVGTRYFRLHNPGVSVECRETKGFCVLNYTILDQVESGDEQTLDMAIAGMFRVMQSLCGYHWQPVEVRLAHSRPRNLVPFRTFFQAPLVFDAEESALVFRSYWLDQLLSSADPLLHLFMQEHVTEVEAGRAEDLPGRLQRLLPSLVAMRRATPAEAARRLGMGVRTLNRRLAAAGTTFSVLLDRSRHSCAVQLLGNTTLPPGQVATRLGYANTSAFTRAFRRWNGVTPTEWRRLR